jgi:hypothetical protein
MPALPRERPGSHLARRQHLRQLRLRVGHQVDQAEQVVGAVGVAAVDASIDRHWTTPGARATRSGRCPGSPAPIGEQEYPRPETTTGRGPLGDLRQAEPPGGCPGLGRRPIVGFGKSDLASSLGARGVTGHHEAAPRRSTWTTPFELLASRADSLCTLRGRVARVVPAPRPARSH